MNDKNAKVLFWASFLTLIAAGMGFAIRNDIIVDWGQQFGFTQYTPKEGLAQSQVRCIAQDGEGYLWFGTLGGVSRFDGHSFTNYALQEGLPDAQVNAVLCAKDGTVWLGAGGSLMTFSGMRTSIIELPGEARDARILALAEDGHGSILIGTDGAGALRACGSWPSVGGSGNAIVVLLVTPISCRVCR